ncbi:uncharacterized protein LOC120354756 [Nilaparvata lugens]|uniref:uncharacterized protein LOC120354756 n=1 Tax=Nilaparvata lugens TaxID=108931 RepID=UPI00193E18A2|nr:uncharacterized protein LOC120354756 [Nilaparvata lugens]
MDEFFRKLFRRKLFYSILLGYFIYFVGTYPREPVPFKYTLQVALFVYACIKLMDNLFTYKEVLVFYVTTFLIINYGHYLPNADPITTNPKYIRQQMQDGYFIVTQTMDIYALLVFMEICMRLRENRQR